MSLNKLVICGVGLIGGSLARALKAAGAVKEVVGVGRSEASLARARELGVIDRAAVSMAEAVAGADIVVLAAPVAQTPALLAAIRPFLGGDTIVTDAGSTKTDAVTAAKAALGDEVWRFVPGHPIAGAELSGVDAAKADLYLDRRVVLCPQTNNRHEDVARVRAMWEATGARVSEMSETQHDRVFASVSHLPHVLSYALIAQILEAPTLPRNSVSRAVVFATLRASRHRIRKCGAISVWPIARHCSPNSMATSRRSRVCVN